jgi:hypothetical protein
MRRDDFLDMAAELINGQRQANYGEAKVNFSRLALRMSQHINKNITSWQAALILVELKMARLANGYHEDSIVDAIGYLALAGELWEIEHELERKLSAVIKTDISRG